MCYFVLVRMRQMCGMYGSLQMATVFLLVRFRLPFPLYASSFVLWLVSFCIFLLIVPNYLSFATALFQFHSFGLAATCMLLSVLLVPINLWFRTTIGHLSTTPSPLCLPFLSFGQGTVQAQTSAWVMWRSS